MKLDLFRAGLDDDDLIITNMKIIYDNYDNIKRYIKTQVYKNYKDGVGFFDYEDITHNVIIEVYKTFESINNNTFNKNNKRITDKGIHILYLKGLIKINIFNTIKKMGKKEKWEVNKEDLSFIIQSYGEVESFMDTSLLGLDTDIKEEFYIVLDSLEDYEIILLKYSEIFTTRILSDLLNEEYNKLTIKIKNLKDKIKQEVLDRIKDKNINKKLNNK